MKTIMAVIATFYLGVGTSVIFSLMDAGLSYVSSWALTLSAFGWAVLLFLSAYRGVEEKDMKRLLVLITLPFLAFFLVGVVDLLSFDINVQNPEMIAFLDSITPLFTNAPLMVSLLSLFLGYSILLETKSDTEKETNSD